MSNCPGTFPAPEGDRCRSPWAVPRDITENSLCKRVCDDHSEVVSWGDLRTRLIADKLWAAENQHLNPFKKDAEDA